MGMSRQAEAIDVLLKSSEYGCELSAYREEIATVIEFIGVLEAEEDRQKLRAINAEEQRDYWHEIALRLGPQLHAAERKTAELHAEILNMDLDKGALERERDNANIIATDAKLQNERLVSLVADLKNELRYSAIARHNCDQTHITEKFSQCDRNDCVRVRELLK